MLAGACLWLAGQGNRVTVIGRDQVKLQRLAGQHANIVPVSANYDQAEAFREALRDSLAECGPWALVVAWIHHREKAILTMISEERRRVADCPWQVVHVLGSSSNLAEIRQDMMDLSGCSYHQVQLGFVLEQGYSRWLTHAEIAGGVIEALQTGAKRHVVGTLTPWNKRP